MLLSSLPQGTAVSSRRETTTNPMTSCTVLPAHHNLPTCLPLCIHPAHCCSFVQGLLCSAPTSPVLTAPGHLPSAHTCPPHRMAVLLKRASWNHWSCRVRASPLKSVSYSTWYMGICQSCGTKDDSTPFSTCTQQDSSSGCCGPSKYTPSR